jgi:hypothetical protein
MRMRRLLGLGRDSQLAAATALLPQSPQTTRDKRGATNLLARYAAPSPKAPLASQPQRPSRRRPRILGNPAIAKPVSGAMARLTARAEPNWTALLHSVHHMFAIVDGLAKRLPRLRGGSRASRGDG